MADKAAAASGSKTEEDPAKVAEEVVSNLKSQGMFDKFRKECLEELENMESYRILKQRVENHVASFLSKYQWTEKLSKNSVRDSLRANMNRSEVLLNGIDRLIDQILSSKTESFAERIGPEVDKHLGIERKEEPAPGTTSENFDSNKTSASTSTSSSSQANKFKSQPTSTGACVPLSHPQSKDKDVQGPTLPRPLFTDKELADLQTKSRVTSIKDPSNFEDRKSYDCHKNELSSNNYVNEKENIVSGDLSRGSNMSEPLHSASISVSTMDVEMTDVSNSSQSQVIANVEIGPKSAQNETSEMHSTMSKEQTDTDVSTQDKDEACKNSAADITEQNPESETSTLPIHSDENVDHCSASKAEAEVTSKLVPTGVETDLPESEKELKIESAPMEDTERQGDTVAAKSEKENITQKGEDDQQDSDLIDVVKSTTDNEDASSPVYDFLPDKSKEETAIDLKEVTPLKMEKDERSVEMQHPDTNAINVTKVLTQNSNKEQDLGERMQTVQNTLPTEDATNIEKVTNEKENIDCEDSKQIASAADETEGSISFLEKTTCDENIDESHASSDATDMNEIQKNQNNLVVKKEEEIRSIDSTVEDTKEIVKKDSPSSQEEENSASKTSDDNESSARKDPEPSTDIHNEEIEDEVQKEETQASHEVAAETTENENVTDVDLSSDSSHRVGQRRVRRRKRLISESEDDLKKSKTAKLTESGPSEGISVDKEVEEMHTEDGSCASDLKVKRGRGRPKKTTDKKVEASKSDSEMRSDASSVDDSVERSRGRSRMKKQDELALFKTGVSRQTSVDNESSASDSMTEYKEKDTRRTRRQIKPKRCYSPSDSK